MKEDVDVARNYSVFFYQVLDALKQDTAAVVNAEITTEKRPGSLIFSYFCMSETKIGKWI